MCFWSETKERHFIILIALGKILNLVTSEMNKSSAEIWMKFHMESALFRVGWLADQLSRDRSDSAVDPATQESRSPGDKLH